MTSTVLIDKRARRLGKALEERLSCSLCPIIVMSRMLCDNEIEVMRGESGLELDFDTHILSAANQIDRVL